MVAVYGLYASKIDRHLRTKGSDVLVLKDCALSFSKLVIVYWLITENGSNKCCC